MTAPLPLCVVGGGSIGMRHVEVTQTCSATRLTAIVEADPARRAALADQGFPVVACIGDAPPETRAAIVATPTNDHQSSGVEALAQGWALLVEKPFAATLDEGRALIAAADVKGLPLVCGHHRRCHPFSRTARDALHAIGDPVGVQAFWSLRKHDSYFDAAWRRLPGHGPVMSNLSHEIDLLHFLFGRVTQVTALTSNARRGFAIEDSAAIALRFDTGALGSVLISDAGASPWAFEAASGENPAISASGEDYLRFTGARGALSFPSLTRWGASGPGEVEWSRPLARIDAARPDRIDPLLEQVARFASVVAGGTDDVLCTGTDGLAALEATLAVPLSAQSCAPVDIGTVPGDYRGTRETRT